MLVERDGFVEGLYHFLWAKNINSETCPEILLPDVVIYKYRIPAYWYFTSADGQLKRKNKANIINKKIYEDFSKGRKDPADICAYYISDCIDAQAEGRRKTTIEFFDKKGLYEFLFNREKTNDGFIQKFIEPKGTVNAMIQATWSPQVCLLERRVNVNALHDRRVPLYDRCVTYEGSHYLSNIAPVRGTILPNKLQRLCWNIVSHIRSTSLSHHQISRMLVNFKTDAEDNVWLLWCSSLRLSSNEGEHVSSPVNLTVRLVPAPQHSKPRILPASTNEKSSPTALSTTRRQSKHDKKDIKPEWMVFDLCPGCNRSMVTNQRYSLPFKSVISFHQRKAKIMGGNENSIPPLLQRIQPSLFPEQFRKERTNPLFLFNKVTLCEACYLGFTALDIRPMSAAATHRAISNVPTIPSLPSDLLPNDHLPDPRALADKMFEDIISPTTKLSAHTKMESRSMPALDQYG